MIKTNAKEFDISEGLKSHHTFEYEIMDLIELFLMLFKHKKKELLEQFQRGNDKIYGELTFGHTIYNISDMIVYKYFNDNLSFAQRALIRSSKFKEYPFNNKIIELHPKL